MIRMISPAGLLVVISGPVVWSVGFSILYGLSALGCEYGWVNLQIGGISLIRGLLLLVWLLHLAAILLILRYALVRRANGRLGQFMHFLAVALSLTALIAMLWTGFPVAITTDCL